MYKLSVFHNGKLIKELSLTPGEEYIIGRDATADIQLGVSKGISRQHLKISFNEPAWYLEVLSQYGNLHYDGEEVDELFLDENTQFNLPPYDFHFSIEKVKVKESRKSENVPPPPPQEEIHNELNLPATSEPDLSLENKKTNLVPHNNNYKNPHELALESFSDEDTSPGSASNLVGIIKWHDLNGKKKGYKFSNSCVVGRGENCDVTIKHNKMSRKHFEINKENNKFYVLDLGSANGTKVNNKPVSTHQPLQVESGDEISISNLKFNFEIKDEQFANKLSNVPMVQNHGPDRLPMPPQIAGARVVRVSKNQHRQVISDPGRKNKLVRLAIMLLVPVLLIGLLLEPEKEQNEKGKTDLASVVTFDKLTPEEKQIVIDSFRLGKSHFNQKKYANCIKEFEKIHNIIPFYENSKELIGLCEQALALEREVLVEEEKERKQRELEQRIAVIVEDCRAKMNQFRTADEANSCIAEAMTMFPDHPAILDFQNTIAMREQSERDQAAAKARRQKLIQQGENAYNAANSEFKKQSFRKAIDLFNKYLAGNFPDTKGHKEIAERDLASAKTQLTKKVDELFGECKKNYNDRKFKEAIFACDKATSEDPKNDEVLSFRKSILSELRKEMKLMYQDAILEENLGNVDAAKEKWKKIMELDIPSDEYYKKSESKLKKYGIGI
ncbi:MAG: FHA domain-containing protein [Bdellovibrionales bacterium]|nr:FHA domain-containing protein [Bdellovibrionales bacterium]